MNIVLDAYLQVSELPVVIGGRVLKGSVSFAIMPGQAMRIIGRNGTGKTTLIKTILGILPYSAGEVSFNFPMIIGDTVAYFPQSWVDTLLPWMSAWENIVIGNLKTNRTSIRPALVDLICNIFPEIEIDPFTIRPQSNVIMNSLRNYFAKMNADKLSGGQKEKIVLLRTLLCHPRLLFLDEPYRDLDYASTAALNNFLIDFVKEGNSFVYVSHQDIGIESALTIDMG
jgi:ABC-type multidrug transport system ATPase subunit